MTDLYRHFAERAPQGRQFRQDLQSPAPEDAKPIPHPRQPHRPLLRSSGKDAPGPLPSLDGGDAHGSQFATICSLPGPPAHWMNYAIGSAHTSRQMPTSRSRFSAWTDLQICAFWIFWSGSCCDMRQARLGTCRRAPEAGRWAVPLHFLRTTERPMELSRFCLSAEESIARVPFVKTIHVCSIASTARLPGRYLISRSCGGGVVRPSSTMAARSKAGHRTVG
jgi:hypothetical protein